MAKKILVVDDDEMNLRMAEFILKKNAYEVEKATSGEECLQYLCENAVDLVLLDVEMPGKSGIDTLQQIRGDDKIAETRVMFLTASVDEEIMQKANELGALGYIQKPFLPQTLQDRVESVVGK